MAKLTTAERVSCERSDNFVFQRSLLAYYRASELISGRVLEIGTGSGYGVDIIAPQADHFITLDKFAAPQGVVRGENVQFIEATVPPLPFKDGEFDFVISFQVIEHIKEDKALIAEIHRVLREGGRLIISTPNRDMSLTRNPWHVREYSISEFQELLKEQFQTVETYGVVGNKKVMTYYQKNKDSVAKYKRLDIFNLEHRLPARLLQLPYDILNRINRRKLLKQNSVLTESIEMSDYQIEVVNDNAFDLFYVARKEITI